MNWWNKSKASRLLPFASNVSQASWTAVVYSVFEEKRSFVSSLWFPPTNKMKRRKYMKNKLKINFSILKSHKTTTKIKIQCVFLIWGLARREKCVVENFTFITSFSCCIAFYTMTMQFPAQFQHFIAIFQHWTLYNFLFANTTTTIEQIKSRQNLIIRCKWHNDNTEIVWTGMTILHDIHVNKQEKNNRISSDLLLLLLN